MKHQKSICYLYQPVIQTCLIYTRLNSGYQVRQTVKSQRFYPYFTRFLNQHRRTTVPYCSFITLSPQQQGQVHELPIYLFTFVLKITSTHWQLQTITKTNTTYHLSTEESQCVTPVCPQQMLLTSKEEPYLQTPLSPHSA